MYDLISKLHGEGWLSGGLVNWITAGGSEEKGTGLGMLGMTICIGLRR